MRTHYLVLAWYVVLLVLMCWWAWFTYKYEAYGITVGSLLLALIDAFFIYDELDIIRKKRNDRFKPPPLTTERS